MERCQQCGSELERASRFCSQCGSPLSKTSAESSRASVADAPTMTSLPDAEAPTYPLPGKPSSSRLAPHRSRDEVRFAAGTVSGERYRIASLLGRGGMGEVFRADDLALGQPVALKFLPAALENDFALLEMLHAEVRNARRLSPPNVCGV